MTPHLNRLDETVQMRGHNLCYSAELSKIISNYHQILLLIKSSADLSAYKIAHLTAHCPSQKNFVVKFLSVTHANQSYAKVTKIAPVLSYWGANISRVSQTLLELVIAVF